MKKNILLLAALCLAAVVYADRWDAQKCPDFLTCQSKTGTINYDVWGLWNVWPNFTGATQKDAYTGAFPAQFRIGYSPADTCGSWLDGHLFSLVDAKGVEVLRLDVVRRGRFRLTVNGKKALSIPVHWEPTVIHFNNLKPEVLTIMATPQETALVRQGKTILRVAAMPSGTAPYTARFGRLDDSDRGALGWYNEFTATAIDSATAIPEDAPLPGPAEWNAPLKELNDFFFDESQNPIDTYTPGKVDFYAARRAVGRVAVDSLWYRLHIKKNPCFELFLADLKKLADEIRENKTPNYTIQFDPKSTAAYFLSPDETDFYAGYCGWGMGSYAPEFAIMGINLVAEHVWPHAVSNPDGSFNDGMLRRRVMPHLEEYEKYDIRFDLMVAPYTPGWLLKKHPEWEGVFTGMGLENEKEGIDLHAKQWEGRQAGHGFLKASVLAPDYRKMCEDFLKNALPILTTSKALVAIDLANEITLEDYSPAMQKYLQAFVKRKYGTVKALNKAWGTKYKSFDNVVILRAFAFDRNNPTRFLDWVQCNREAGTEFFQFLHDTARRYAPNIPTHIKTLPYEFGMPWYKFGSNERNFYDYADGIDRRALTGMTEIIGTDSWADNGHDRYDRLKSDVPYQTTYFSLLRSYNPTKWIFDSEWHINRCDPPVTKPLLLDMVMTQNFIHGLRAGTFWVACPGINLKLDMTSQPHLFLQSGLTTATLRSQKAWFDALARRPRPIGVLYSTHSRYLDGDKHIKALLNLHEAAMFAGIDLRLVDERQLIDGTVTAKDLKLLIVPECPMPRSETLKALQAFNKTGTSVVFGGSFANLKTGKLPGTSTPLEADIRRLSVQLRGIAKRYGVFPTVEVVDANGQPVYGVEWHVATMPDGKQLLYIANMSKAPVNLIVNGAPAIVNLRTGEKLPAKNALSMRIWDTFVGAIAP